jgi:hypothetical protein
MAQLVVANETMALTSVSMATMLFVMFKFHT